MSYSGVTPYCSVVVKFIHRLSTVQDAPGRFDPGRLPFFAAGVDCCAGPLGFLAEELKVNPTWNLFTGCDGSRALPGVCHQGVDPAFLARPLRRPLRVPGVSASEPGDCILYYALMSCLSHIVLCLSNLNFCNLSYRSLCGTNVGSNFGVILAEDK